MKKVSTDSTNQTVTRMKKPSVQLTILLSIFLILSFTTCRKNSSDLDVIEVSGLIEAIKIEIRAKVLGEISQVFVQEGQKVSKNDLLCLIDDEKLQIQLNQVQAGLEGAKSKLALAKKGTKKELIAVAKNQLEIAARELEQAKKDQERMTKLLEEGAVSQHQKDLAELRYAQAKEGHKIADESYGLALRGREKEEVEMIEAEIKSLEAQQQLLQSQIQDTKVLSPISGFLETRHVEPGELALAGTILFSLVDLNQIYVKTYVPEKHIGRVKIGDRVEVQADSFPGRIFEGKIDYISNEAEFAPKNIQTREERLKLVFMIKSYLQNPDGALKPGMPVDVRIATHFPPSAR